MNEPIRISHVHFHNYKALRNIQIYLDKINVLVGPNNCGKSTVIGVFRLLAHALRFAAVRNPVLLPTDLGERMGHRIAFDQTPVSLENAQTDYSDSDSKITFKLTNGNELSLVIAKDRRVLLLHNSPRMVRSTVDFRREFPFAISAVPVLGPVEHDEPIVAVETVKREQFSHRASRHFRNHWRYEPEKFGEFAELLKKSWPGMEILPPERLEGAEHISMFCKEHRITRELYWSGLGFQVWCQLLSNIIRARGANLLVVDEPEIYLHPDIQRQLLELLRETGASIVMATHSAEIISAADPSEIKLVNKNSQRVRSAKDVSEVQIALDSLGSAHNLRLAELSRHGRIIYCEGDGDWDALRKFARVLSLDRIARAEGITMLPSGGFSSWREIESLAKRAGQLLDRPLKIAVVYDRDFYSQEELDDIGGRLKAVGVLALHLGRKEMENYLVEPAVLSRLIKSNASERTSGVDCGEAKILNDVSEIADEQRSDCLAQYISKNSRYCQGGKADASTNNSKVIEWFEKKWKGGRSRLEVCSGKLLLSRTRRYLQESFGVTATSARLIGEFRKSEVAEDLANIVRALESFSRA